MSPRLVHRLGGSLLALLMTGLTTVVLTSTAEPAEAGNTSNPFAGRQLGVTTLDDAGNQIYTDFTSVSGDYRTLLGRSAMRSRARFYGAWSGTGSTLESKLRRYIEDAQKGDPSTIVPLVTFRMWPRGEGDRAAFSTTDSTRFKQWYDAAARAIGDSRVAVIFEPDLPLILPRHGTADTKARMALSRYAVKKLSALPRTSVYVDAGSADWLRMHEVVPFLQQAGVAYARGFSLGATHYDSTSSNVLYARQVSLALANKGIRGKKAVIDTADNGRPFTHGKYHQLLRSGARVNHFDNADVCVNRTQQYCNTLGIPPTADVANRRWRHTDAVNSAARGYVDAYLWFGRPWLRMQADPYCRVRALQVGRTTPWMPATKQLSAAYVRAQQKRECFRAP